MTSLQIAKSRTSARAETHVAYRGDVSNQNWNGMTVTVGTGDANGGRWGHLGQPAKRFAMARALGGTATSVTTSASSLKGYDTWAGGIFVGGKLRIYRAVNGQIQLIRTADVTGEVTDCWTPIGTSSIITGNSLEWLVPDVSARGVDYTFGIARVDASGLIGPVTTTTLTFPNSGYTTATAATPTTSTARPAIVGRTGALAAVTGFTAQIRAGTTHNVQFSWTGTGNFVVFINWDGSSDRLDVEATLSFASGPVPIAGDMLVFESAPILAMQPSWISRRVRTGNGTGAYGPSQLTYGYNNNDPSGRTWQYVAYGAGIPKPDLTYPDYYLRLNGTASLPARAECAFHSGTDQSYYDVLVPGRTYRAEFIASASSPMNATFAVTDATLSGSGTIALTTTPQTFVFEFTRSSTLKTNAARSWSLTGATNNVSINLLSVRLWDTSRPYQRLMVDLPAGIDVRDHNLIKQFPSPTLDAITSRDGSGPSGWGIASLLSNCSAYSCNPHFQIEWFYDDQFYYDLTTFLFAPATSGEPLALKREALGIGPVHSSFARYLYEDGNERWNLLMWAMFSSATDSVTAASYTQGQLCGMFSARRRSIMQSNPYWPAANPPKEFVGGWLINSAFSTQAAQFPGAAYTSTALYTSGTDVNQVILADNKERWTDILTIGEVSHRSNLTALKNAVSGVELAIYEAGPGYQLNGLNGATVTKAGEVVQECMCKSIGGTTAMMASIGISAQIGAATYNFFTWGEGPYWQASRTPAEGGGLYRVAAFLKGTHELLGRCRIYSTNKFIDRKQPVTILNSNGTFLRTDNAPRASIYHFESLTYPGRHGILYVNLNVNRDAFGAGHPDYVAGDTGAADFRYHTGLPSTAVPFKVLRNEGNFRQHDAYKVGFRPNVVGSTIDGYVADPLCVDLTVTPENFTVPDTALRTLTLLGGNCRLEIYNT